MFLPPRYLPVLPEIVVRRFTIKQGGERYAPARLAERVVIRIAERAESVFAWPGMGQRINDSINVLDRSMRCHAGYAEPRRCGSFIPTAVALGA